MEKNEKKNLWELFLTTTSKETRKKILSVILTVIVASGVLSYREEIKDLFFSDTETIQTDDSLKVLNYCVKKGDFAYKILESFGMDEARFLELNGYDNISELDIIKPGDSLIVEASIHDDSIPYEVHKVVKGQTLEDIAKEYSCTVEELVFINAMDDEGKLPDVLYLPEYCKKTENISTPTDAEYVTDDAIQIKKGYSDFSTIFGTKVGEDSFVILDVGNHYRIGVKAQDKKLSYCQENKVPAGIIISSEAKTAADIYSDIAYAKSVLFDYDIKFPVYLGVDDIITDASLTTDQKGFLIKTFLEKCSENGMYVGIYGTDSNLCLAKKYCDVVVDYDAYVVMDSDAVKYDGTYYVYETLDGLLHSKLDLAGIIVNRGFNKSENFFNDATHEVGDEDILDIALSVGMSVDDILKYNGIDKDDIKPGKVLSIPTMSTSVSSTIDREFKVLQNPIKGCDISKWQGTDIDWDTIDKNFEFMIIRCSVGLRKDLCYEVNSTNCNLNNIPLGVFCYNGITCFGNENYSGKKISLDEYRKLQEQQADFAIGLLKGKDITYPVYIDFEKPDNPSFTFEKLWPDREHIKIMLDVWREKIIEAGYVPGIYVNEDGFKHIRKKLPDYELSDDFELWMAGGPWYDVETKVEEALIPHSVFEEYDGVSIAQSTACGTDGGAGNSEGYLDVNFSYVDYSQSDIQHIEDEVEIKEFNDREGEVTTGEKLLIVSTLGGTAIAGISFTKSKKKQKIKQ